MRNLHSDNALGCMLPVSMGARRLPNVLDLANSNRLPSANFQYGKCKPKVVRLSLNFLLVAQSFNSYQRGFLQPFNFGHLRIWWTKTVEFSQIFL
jgi:hypothetical protein